MDSTTFFDRLFDLIAGKGVHVIVWCVIVFVIAYLIKSLPLVGPAIWKVLAHASQTFSKVVGSALSWGLIRVFNFAVNLLVTVAYNIGVALYCLGMYVMWQLAVRRARSNGRRLPIEPNYPGPPVWIVIATPPKAKPKGHGEGGRN